VERDGPAAHSGLVRDDVIVALGAEAVRSTDQLAFRIEMAAPGAAVPLSIIREGVRLEFPVTMGSQARLEERSAQGLLPVHDDRARTGMVLAESTGEVSLPIGRIFGTGEGLLVAGLLPGGPAYLAGARRRDLLVEACGKSLRTIAHYAEALQGAAPGGAAALVFLRGGERLELTIPIEAEATRIDEFSLPLSLFASKRSAAEKGFSVLWGALLHSRRAYEIDSSLWRDEHISRREWGFLLNLVRYSAVDGKRELRLFWILPFRSTIRTRE